MSSKFAIRAVGLLLVFILLLTTAGVAGCGSDDGSDKNQAAAGDASTDASVSGGDVSRAAPTGPAADANSPAKPVRLVFVHHSVGEDWLADEGGGLGQALMANNYFVSDTNYGWGPDGIGDTTDIGDWYTWFAGPDSYSYTGELFAWDGQSSEYSRMAEDPDPAGENEIVMFKSCYPNSGLGGNPDDEPAADNNPLRGEDSSSENHTVANAKGIYIDLLSFFSTRQDKLFIVITAPPMSADETDAVQAANARAFNTWLVEDWLADYPYSNVAVFDFYNVLTTNGGDRETSDSGSESGNHHRLVDGEVQYVNDQGGDLSAYDSWGDSHPTAAGGQKATDELIGLLNYWYDRWADS